MISALMLALVLAQPQDSSAFVKDIVAAINHHSLAERRALQHPRDAAGCPTSLLMEWVVSQQEAYTVAADFQWRITEMAVGPPPFAGMVRYAIKPTHQLQLDWRSASGARNTIVLRVVHDASGWHEVFGCPTAAAAQQISQARAEAQQQQAEVARRIGSMPHALRDSVLALDALAEGAGAVQYYMAAAKLPYPIADAVVAALRARHRLTYQHTYRYNTEDLIEDHYMVMAKSLLP